jgi:hypothetical protein
MSDDFMAEILRDRGLPDKIETKPVTLKTEVAVETTKWFENEKVKETHPIKEEKKEVETKFLREKTIYLSYDLGATINLSNFNMGKVNVSLSMPVGMEITPELMGKIHSSYDFMKKLVESKVEQEVKELIKMRDAQA